MKCLVVKFTETESRAVVAGSGDGAGELLFSGYRDSFWGDEGGSGDAHTACERTSHYPTVHLEMVTVVNVILCSPFL